MAEEKGGTVKEQSRYLQMLRWVFSKHYEEGDTRVMWNQPELVEAAAALGVDLPKNLGDVLYSVRYRSDFPKVLLRCHSAE